MQAKNCMAMDKYHYFNLTSLFNDKLKQIQNIDPKNTELRLIKGFCDSQDSDILKKEQTG